MTKHYSPVTNKLESCVGSERCKYGDNELAVHFEDHEQDAAQKYMDTTNERLFGLFPSENKVESSTQELKLQQFVDQGQLGIYHTAAMLAELEEHSEDYRYGQALENAKYYEKQTRNDFEIAKSNHNEYLQGPNDEAFKRMVTSYALMMSNFYTDQHAQGTKDQVSFLNDEIDTASKIQEDFKMKVNELDKAKRKLSNFQKIEPVEPGIYNPPRIFGRAKYKKDYGEKTEQYQAYLSEKEDVNTAFDKAQQERDEARVNFKSSSKAIFKRVSNDLLRISDEENLEKDLYQAKLQETWEKGFKPGKAPVMPENWGHPDDIIYMREDIA